MLSMLLCTKLYWHVNSQEIIQLIMTNSVLIKINHQNGYLDHHISLWQQITHNVTFWEDFVIILCNVFDSALFRTAECTGTQAVTGLHCD